MDWKNEEARALRRHQAARLKKARRMYWGGFRTSLEGDARRMGMVLATPHPCSCRACANERRVTGLPSLRERAWLQHSLDESLQEA